MGFDIDGKFTKEDEEATFGSSIEAGIEFSNTGDDATIGARGNNRLHSIDRFQAYNIEIPSINYSETTTNMKFPIYLLLSSVALDAIPANKILFGRIGDDSIEAKMLRNRVYNPFFILNDNISQDLSVYRRPSDSRLEQSVDDNVFDLTDLSSVNPFKNTTLREFNQIVNTQIDSLSRFISNQDNRSDFVQDFKKDANVSPEDYKKLKIRKASSTELRGMNRKRSTSV